MSTPRIIPKIKPLNFNFTDGKKVVWMTYNHPDKLNKKKGFTRMEIERYAKDALESAKKKNDEIQVYLKYPNNKMMPGKWFNRKSIDFHHLLYSNAAYDDENDESDEDEPDVYKSFVIAVKRKF